MIIKEYRLLLPMSLSEFEKGQRFSVVEASKNETGGGQGVEILKEESFSSETVRPGHMLQGVFTHKKYYLREKASWFLRMILPKEAMTLEEKSWNAFPYTKTILSNPESMKDSFYISVETVYLADNGETENALGLTPDLLEKREVVNLNIYDETHLKDTDITPETDVRIFRSEKANRGPLKANWEQIADPLICAYKVCYVHFKWFGLQVRLEKYFHSNYPRLFTKFHREIFCWMDKWYDLTTEDICEIEKQAASELTKQFKNGKVIGMTASEPEKNK